MANDSSYNIRWHPPLHHEKTYRYADDQLSIRQRHYSYPLPTCHAMFRVRRNDRGVGKKEEECKCSVRKDVEAKVKWRLNVRD